jgi:formate--tetrahydrofolate ligase
MSEPTGVREIAKVAHDLGVADEDFIPYGRRKAKLGPGALQRPVRARMILVSALTPTDAGEGKTTTSIGLAQGLAKLGQRPCLALREPSLGPVFGMKGGATGGGLSRLTPGEDINLHFNGDFHAITSAHNLLSALVDNHLQQGNKLGLDPRRLLWRRVIDMNDRALRNVIVGLGGPLEGVPRETGFDITPASEVMAILCLSKDAEDLRARLSRIVVGLTRDKQPVTAADLKAVGAMMALLKDALLPNLVQTLDGVPALVHGGPFANIAHGCNSVIATRAAMGLADWVVTEAGFGFDLGGEKFMDIKCRTTGLSPAAVVIVATIRALKRHGGVAKDALNNPDPAAVERGLGNLMKHVESAKAFDRVPVVAINRFPTDTEEETQLVERACAAVGVRVARNEGFARGAEGGVALAEAVMAQALAEAPPVKPLYELADAPKAKMEKVARTMYGATSVAWTREAEADLERAKALGGDALPLCVAKTQMSLSDDPKRAGRPENFEVTVRRVVLAAGAGFLVPLLGEIIRMPGLPAGPQAEKIDLVNGEVVGILG